MIFSYIQSYHFLIAKKTNKLNVFQRIWLKISQKETDSLLLEMTNQEKRPY